VGIFTLTQVAAVPEPSTWAMMVLGFAGLGFMGQGHIAFLCGPRQVLGNALARFMIAAIWQVPADFFQYHVHIRGLC
jgi:hypothetical protein